MNALELAQARIIEAQEAHQKRLNALVERKATAEAEAAEWEAKRAKMVFLATTHCLEKEGYIAKVKPS